MLNSFYEIEKQNVCDDDSVINAHTDVSSKYFQ